MEMKLKLMIGLIFIGSCATCAFAQDSTLKIFTETYDRYYVVPMVKDLISEIRSVIKLNETFSTGTKKYYYKQANNIALYATRDAVYRTPNVCETYTLFNRDNLSDWYAQVWIYQGDNKLVTLMYYSKNFYYVVDITKTKIVTAKYKKDKSLLSTDEQMNK